MLQKLFLGLALGFCVVALESCHHDAPPPPPGKDVPPPRPPEPGRDVPPPAPNSDIPPRA